LPTDKRFAAKEGIFSYASPGHYVYTEIIIAWQEFLSHRPLPQRPAKPAIPGHIESRPPLSDNDRAGRQDGNFFMKRHLSLRIILITIPVLVIVSVFFLLPSLLEIFLLPRLTRDLPLTDKAINIISITPRALQGSVLLANNDQPVLTIPRFEVRYSLSGLLRREIEGIVLEGAVLHLQNKAGRFNGLPTADKPAQAPTLSFRRLPTFPVEIYLKDSSVIVHRSKMANRQVRFDARINMPTLPLPPQQSGKPGNLAISRVTYDGNEFLSLNADLELTDNSLTAKGMVASPLLPELHLLFNAATEGGATLRLTAELPERPFAISTLAPIVDMPPGLRSDGRISGKASFNIGPDRSQGSAALQVSRGNLELPDKKIVIRGIDLSLALPELPLFHSDPVQPLSIETLDIGELRFSKARVQFHLKDSQTLFIEKARVAWCGGHVESGGLTLSAGTKELKTVLTCDSLDLAQVLAQIGVSDSEGQGTLNGRLPLTLSGTDIRFEDGLLFSTPGEHGRLRFKDTDTLRRGMPALDSAATFDYALDALKDISYNSLRLNLNTTGNDLLISMRIDGKPAVPLPYGYRGGQIVRDAEGAGMQHPILLDVNFHLPSAEIFRYGKNIQSIREKM
jgi:hypothetical protein